MASRKLLVVTGDYGVVQQVKQALGGKSFAIHAAYSHLDAVYQLKYEPFELVLVDDAMVNRKTGEQTAAALLEMEKHPPLLIYTHDNGSGQWSMENVVTSLDEATLRLGIARILQIPTLMSEVPPQPLPEPERKAPKSESENVTSIFWRDEEMQTLFALGRSLTEVLDLSEVLNRVVEAARRLTNAEEGMILLPDGQSGQLYLRAKVGIDVEVADNFRVKTHDTIAGTVFQTGQPVLINESGPQKVKTEYFVNSLLYVPIIEKTQTLGVLGVNNKNKHDIFTERHRDLLINLASYAAVAIENARVHGQSIRRTHELKALVDASQVINASLSFERTLPAICEQFIHVLNVGYAEICLWERDERLLRPLARSQQARWRGNQHPTIQLAERPVIRLALDSRRHVLLRYDRHDIPVEQELLERVGANAMLIVPIVGGDQVIGMLQAYYVNFAETTLPADAIHRVQRIMLEALASFAGSDDFTHSFRPLQDVNAALGADWVEFFQLTPDNTALKLQFAAGKAVWQEGNHPPIDISPYPDIVAALEAQKPLNHYQSEESLPAGMSALFARTQSRSLLALPLIGRGQTQGLVLFADTLHEREFSAREIDLGRAIVGQAATALENVNLVRDLEASLRELRETQNRLVQTARLSAMGELAAAVAHQINNPLTTIVLDTELLLESEARQPSDYGEAISAISRSGKRAAGVVRRLLAMARPISAETPRAAIDVIYTIEEIVALVRPHIEREGIYFTTRLPNETLPNVWAMPGELDDVWLNLILNAHDALIGRNSPEIEIVAFYDSPNEMIEVVVADNGAGIPPEHQGEIFKPFFTTKPPGEGTGLGLHICRQVVDRVGGSISVETSPEGTQFIVRLPIMRGM